MKLKQLTDAYLLRLERGEEVISSLEAFANDNSIDGAFFHGLGGADQATLGIFRIDTDKQYHFTDYEGEMEIVSLNGNISRDSDGEVMVHCHSVISGLDLKASGGHVKSMRVAGTCEIFIDTRVDALTRTHDDDIGLKLLDFTQNE